MKAVVVTGPGQLSLERLPDPSPSPAGVVIAVRSCGICGTDADELTIVGSMAILRSFPAAIDTIGRHADRLAPLVTDQFAVEHFDEALQTVADGRSVKTVLTP